MRMTLAALALSAAIALCARDCRANELVPRVYIWARCGLYATRADSTPVVDLDSATLHAKPQILGLTKTRDIASFSFDLQPGRYTMSIEAQAGNLAGCDRLWVPLLVLPSHDRHIFLDSWGFLEKPGSAYNAIAGAFDRAAPLGMKLIIYDKPAKCGARPDSITARESDVVVDDGAYYQNFPALGRFQGRIGLRMDVEGPKTVTVLLTQTPRGDIDHHAFLQKDITLDILQAVRAADPSKVLCIPGF